MATVSFAGLDQNFNIAARTVSYTGAPDVGGSDTQYSWTSPENNYVQFSGAGFTFNGNGVPTGGTVDTLLIDLANDFGNYELAITGLSFSLTALAPLADGSLTNADPTVQREAENDLIWRTVLAGDDTIDLSNASDTYGITFAGDGRDLTGRVTVLGGDDIISGNVGSLSILVPFVSGDFFTVAAGASLFGGDDTMTVAGFTANGDAYDTFGAVIGGDDDMAVQAGGNLRYMNGDVDYVRAGGSLAGGDDRLDTTANGIGVDVYGDSYDVRGGMTGGDDTVVDGGSGSFLVGDAVFVRAGAVVRGGDDTIMGGGGADTIYGDWTNVEAGARIRGGGADRLFGEAGNDTIYGNEGDDLLDGGADNDTLDGGLGSDTLIGGLGADTLNGGAGSDTASYANATAGVVASLANAAINTGEAAGDTYVSIESLIGSAFADTLNGANAVNNTLRGGAGNDVLKGYTGNDDLEGGAGNDTFVFNTTLNAATNVDTILDFRNQSGNDDRFLLDDAFFAGISGDPANGGRLLSGFYKNITTGTQDANDKILYQQSTGELIYDANGLTAGGQTVFAKVTVNTVLTYQDFFVN